MNIFKEIKFILRKKKQKHCGNIGKVFKNYSKFEHSNPSLSATETPTKSSFQRPSEKVGQIFGQTEKIKKFKSEQIFQIIQNLT